MSSGFLDTLERKILCEFRVLAFLGTANPLGILVPDVPKPGFWVPGNGNPIPLMTWHLPRETPHLS
jgi:hypothetical protein